MPLVEINIEIRYDADAERGQHGISSTAEVVVDECFYSWAGDPDSALCAAQEALEKAAKVCEERGERAFAEMIAARPALRDAETARVECEGQGSLLDRGDINGDPS